MSAHKTKKVKMATKSCPECDQQIPVACKSCPCGYVFISRKLLNAKFSECPSPAITGKVHLTKHMAPGWGVIAAWHEAAINLMASEDKMEAIEQLLKMQARRTVGSSLRKRTQDMEKTELKVMGQSRLSR
ncbi:UPF0547 protein C16orf87 homolog [Poecilia formosa]|uniref:UPF0547 protein C16orf87 homolog n=1 Tax=Poecilia formosa TaxID=48698 RepID=UPI0007B8FD44|nr:PREDICTED: UPF0547 protein C16orf87 homolog [Poecilia formosa]